MGLIWDDISPWTGVREEADGNFVIADIARAGALPAAGAARSGEPGERGADVDHAGREERRMTEVPEVASSGGTLAVEFSPLVLDYAGAHLLRLQIERAGTASDGDTTARGAVRGLPPGNTSSG